MFGCLKLGRGPSQSESTRLDDDDDDDDALGSPALLSNRLATRQASRLCFADSADTLAAGSEEGPCAAAYVAISQLHTASSAQSSCPRDIPVMARTVFTTNPSTASGPASPSTPPHGTVFRPSWEADSVTPVQPWCEGGSAHLTPFAAVSAARAVGYDTSQQPVGPRANRSASASGSEMAARVVPDSESPVDPGATRETLRNLSRLGGTLERDGDELSTVGSLTSTSQYHLPLLNSKTSGYMIEEGGVGFAELMKVAAWHNLGGAAAASAAVTATATPAAGAAARAGVDGGAYCGGGGGGRGMDGAVGVHGGEFYGAGDGGVYALRISGAGGEVCGSYSALMALAAAQPGARGCAHMPGWGCGLPGQGHSRDVASGPLPGDGTATGPASGVRPSGGAPPSRGLWSPGLADGCIGPDGRPPHRRSGTLGSTAASSGVCPPLQQQQQQQQQVQLLRYRPSWGRIRSVGGRAVSSLTQVPEEDSKAGSSPHQPGPVLPPELTSPLGMTTAAAATADMDGQPVPTATASPCPAASSSPADDGGPPVGPTKLSGCISAAEADAIVQLGDAAATVAAVPDTRDAAAELFCCAVPRDASAGEDLSAVFELQEQLPLSPTAAPPPLAPAGAAAAVGPADTARGSSQQGAPWEHQSRESLLETVVPEPESDGGGQLYGTQHGPSRRARGSEPPLGVSVTNLRMDGDRGGCWVGGGGAFGGEVTQGELPAASPALRASDVPHAPEPAGGEERSGAGGGGGRSASANLNRVTAAAADGDGGFKEAGAKVTSAAGPPSAAEEAPPSGGFPAAAAAAAAKISGDAHVRVESQHQASSNPGPVPGSPAAAPAPALDSGSTLAEHASLRVEIPYNPLESALEALGPVSSPPPTAAAAAEWVKSGATSPRTAAVMPGGIGGSAVLSSPVPIVPFANRRLGAAETWVAPSSSGGSRRYLQDLVRRCGSSLNTGPTAAARLNGGSEWPPDWQVPQTLASQPQLQGGSAAASPVPSLVSTPGAGSHHFRSAGLLDAGERSVGPVGAGGGAGGCGSAFSGDPGSPGGSIWASPVKLTRLVSGTLPYMTYTSYMPHPGAAMQVDPSEVVLGKLIGRGCAGRVYKGTFRGQVVAVKVITPGAEPAAADGATTSAVWGEEQVKSLEKEAALAYLLEHPNIVSTHAVFTRVSSAASPGPQQQQQQAPLPPHSPATHRTSSAHHQASQGQIQIQIPVQGALDPASNAARHPPPSISPARLPPLDRWYPASPSFRGTSLAGAAGAAAVSSASPFSGLSVSGQYGSGGGGGMSSPVTGSLSRTVSRMPSGLIRMSYADDGVTATATSGSAAAVLDRCLRGSSAVPSGSSAPVPMSTAATAAITAGGSQPLLRTGPLRCEVFIVMELCPCGSLRAALDAKKLHNKKGVPHLHEVLPLAWEVACALQYLHANSVIHGDLKAANVMLAEALPSPNADHETPRGPSGLSAAGSPRRHGIASPRPQLRPTFTAKVADFSHSHQVELSLRRLREGEGQGQEGHPEGAADGAAEMASPSHAAPELFEEGGRPTFQSDVYSLGVVLWELYSGRKPYDKFTVGEVLASKRTVPTAEVLSVQDSWIPEYGNLCQRCWLPPAERPSLEDIVTTLVLLCRSKLPHVQLCYPVAIEADGDDGDDDDGVATPAELPYDANTGGPPLLGMEAAAEVRPVAVVSMLRRAGAPAAAARASLAAPQPVAGSGIVGCRSSASTMTTSCGQPGEVRGLSARAMSCGVLHTGAEEEEDRPLERLPCGLLAKALAVPDGFPYTCPGDVWLSPLSSRAMAADDGGSGAAAAAVSEPKAPPGSIPLPPMPVLYGAPEPAPGRVSAAAIAITTRASEEDGAIGAGELTRGSGRAGGSATACAACTSPRAFSQRQLSAELYDSPRRPVAPTINLSLSETASQWPRRRGSLGGSAAQQSGSAAAATAATAAAPAITVAAMPPRAGRRIAASGQEALLSRLEPLPETESCHLRLPPEHLMASTGGGAVTNTAAAAASTAAAAASGSGAAAMGFLDNLRPLVVCTPTLTRANAGSSRSESVRALSAESSSLQPPTPCNVPVLPRSSGCEEPSSGTVSGSLPTCSLAAAAVASAAAASVAGASSVGCAGAGVSSVAVSGCTGFVLAAVDSSEVAPETDGARRPGSDDRLFGVVLLGGKYGDKYGRFCSSACITEAGNGSAAAQLEHSRGGFIAIHRGFPGGALGSGLRIGMGAGAGLVRGAAGGPYWSPGRFCSGSLGPSGPQRAAAVPSTPAFRSTSHGVGVSATSLTDAAAAVQGGAILGGVGGLAGNFMPYTPHTISHTALRASADRFSGVPPSYTNPAGGGGGMLDLRTDLAAIASNDGSGMYAGSPGVRSPAATLTGMVGISPRKVGRQHSRNFTTRELEAVWTSIPRFGDVPPSSPSLAPTSALVSPLYDLSGAAP